MYNIKKVSEILGIPTVTIRAWENRYDIITPTRSQGGHRLYSEADIETLQWLKTQMDEKQMKISEAVRLWRKQAHDIAEEPAPNLLLHKNYSDLIEQLYGYLVEFQTSQAHETIDLAFSLYHYDDVFHHILVPVLYLMGDEWENGLISVAQEHFSSQLIMQRFTQFLRILPVQPHLPRVLALCPEGEHHHIGLMLFTLFLRKKGVDVIYLGPNTPLQGLHEVIEKRQISAVAVSVTDPRHVQGLGEWISLCHKKWPQLDFILGGEGFQQSTTPISAYVQVSDKITWERWFQTVYMRRHAAPL
ncbi:MerR family transcriptional regulator [Paenibacillus rigui]|uniref:MerR family transcriptional regulator n=1 Tax=Paenibacillus rigui TaxID=554312 RepID=A0A229UR35_9BACL|nr:MerR family transcriptional regulator [Paenibacillus rigui]OXM85773.1 hypothetical protein CF651_13815 [Paenibacillus rigui]